MAMFFSPLSYQGSIAPAWRHDDAKLASLSFAVSCFIAALVFTRANRGRVHRWLGSIGRKHGVKDHEAASIASLIGLADRFAYSASKGAILAMTLSVAKDFIEQGIRCNCVCPGRVHTPFVDGFLQKYYPEGEERELKFKELSEYQPIGRMGEPEEIANLAAFLCSEEASFITGGAYDVDGGTMNLR